MRRALPAVWLGFLLLGHLNKAPAIRSPKKVINAQLVLHINDLDGVIVGKWSIHTVCLGLLEMVARKRKQPKKNFNQDRVSNLAIASLSDVLLRGLIVRATLS